MIVSTDQDLCARENPLIHWDREIAEAEPEILPGNLLCSNRMPVLPFCYNSPTSLVPTDIAEVPQFADQRRLTRDQA